MTAIEKLRQRLLELVPEAPDEPPPVDEEPAAPVPKVTVSALGGRRVVELDEPVFARLVTQAGVTGPDLSQSDMGRLINAVKDSGPRHLLDLLVQVRDPASPIYRVRLEGRPWRPGGVNQNALPTGIDP